MSRRTCHLGANTSLVRASSTRRPIPGLADVMEGHDRPFWSFNAGELSAAYANGLSPRVVIDATLAHIRDVNPKLNAIITLDEAGAVEAAEASARRWKDGRPLGPLDGVPVTVKDNILVAGLRATWGSRLYEDFVPDGDELAAQG